VAHGYKRNLGEIAVYRGCNVFRTSHMIQTITACIYFYEEIRQAQLPFKVSHAAEFLVSRLPELRRTGRVNASVALHYHNVIEPRRREGLAISVGGEGCRTLSARNVRTPIILRGGASPASFGAAVRLPR